MVDVVMELKRSQAQQRQQEKELHKLEDECFTRFVTWGNTGFVDHPWARLLCNPMDHNARDYVNWIVRVQPQGTKDLREFTTMAINLARVRQNLARLSQQVTDCKASLRDLEGANVKRLRRSTARESNFLRLDADVCSHILEYLMFDDLCALPCVSKGLRGLIQSISDPWGCVASRAHAQVCAGDNSKAERMAAITLIRFPVMHLLKLPNNPICQEAVELCLNRPSSSALAVQRDLRRLAQRARNDDFDKGVRSVERAWRALMSWNKRNDSFNALAIKLTKAPLATMEWKEQNWGPKDSPKRLEVERQSGQDMNLSEIISSLANAGQALGQARTKLVASLDAVADWFRRFDVKPPKSHATQEPLSHKAYLEQCRRRLGVPRVKA